MNVTIIIVVITCIISYLALQDRGLFQKLMHHPVSEDKNGEWYRMLTSGLVHGDFIHLAINMYVLYEFGGFIEDIFTVYYGATLGRGIFLAVYALMIVLADIPSFLKHRNNSSYSAIGASGAVSGILFMFILFRPWSQLALYGILPIPAIIFGVLYLVYSSWASKNSNDNIGHDAHFFGAVAGIGLMLILIPGSFGKFTSSLINNFPY